MNEQLEWIWESKPTASGFYAITYCWDAEEGMFPGSSFFDGVAWDTALPIVAFAGPFNSKELAEAWADANDVEEQP